MKTITAQDVILKLKEFGANDKESMLNALCDGEALAKMGFADCNQDVVEEAYAIIKNAITIKSVDVDLIENFAVGTFELSDGRVFKVSLDWLTREAFQIEDDVVDVDAREVISAYIDDADDDVKNKALGRIAKCSANFAIVFCKDGDVYNNEYNSCSIHDVGVIYNHQLIDFSVKLELKEWIKENDLDELNKDNLIEFLQSNCPPLFQTLGGHKLCELND